MKVGEAARLVLAGKLPLAILWAITTDPERIQLALILGRPEELPRTTRTPEAAWDTLNDQQRRLVKQLGPATITDQLKAPAPAPTARTPESQAVRRQARLERRRLEATAPPET